MKHTDLKPSSAQPNVLEIQPFTMATKIDNPKYTDLINMTF